MPCSSGGTEDTGRYRWGDGQPKRTTRGGPRSVIRAAWPDAGPTWPAFLEGGAALTLTAAPGRPAPRGDGGGDKGPQRGPARGSGSR